MVSLEALKSANPIWLRTCENWSEYFRVLFSLHASLYVRYHYFPRNTCLLPDKMAILQKKTNIEDNKYMYIFSVL